MVFNVSLFSRIIRPISVVKLVRISDKTTFNRGLLTSPSGAVVPEPKKVPFPFLKLILVLAPSIYLGGAIAKSGATILEENEIFVPTDDEEED